MKPTPVLCSVLLALALAQNASAEPSNSQLASEHFRKGLEHVKANDLDDAASEFEAAYEASPNFAVLYNLGRTYSALGRSVEAVAAFTRYLAEGGATIDTGRRAQVTAAIGFDEKRIGIVNVDVEPTTSDLQIDGRAVPESERSVHLVTGAHSLIVSAPGYRSAARAFWIGRQKTTSVQIRLDAQGTGESMVGLPVSCRVPDVQVSVDGAPRGFTPLPSPIRVPRGTHSVAFQRAGYTSRTRDCSTNSATHCDCGLDVSSLPAPDFAKLILSVSERDAEVLVDGLLWNYSALPFGRHRLELRKFGFLPFDESFALARGETKHLAVTLHAEHAYAEEHLKRIRNQYLVGYSMLGAGGIFAITAGALAVASSHAYEDWRHSNDALEATSSNASNLPILQREASNRALRVRTLDDWSLSAALAGTALLGTGLAVLLLSEDATRYELPSSLVTADGLRLSWAHRF